MSSMQFSFPPSPANTWTCAFCWQKVPQGEIHSCPYFQPAESQTLVRIATALEQLVELVAAHLETRG